MRVGSIVSTTNMEAGSFDHTPGAEQMKAIHVALSKYFQTMYWLEARDGVPLPRVPWDRPYLRR